MTDPAYILIETRAPKIDAKGQYVARVWSTPTGFHVKVYSREARNGLKIARILTGSLCDASGKVIVNAGGEPLVHETPHVFQVESEDDVSIEDAAAKIAADFETAQKYVVARVEKRARDMLVSQAAGL